MTREDTRLALLVLLYHQPAYTANQEILLKGLHDDGVMASRAYVRNELSWLASIEAVNLRDTGGVYIATLSDTGAEHVEGYSALPDIRKPRPGEVKANA